MTRPRSSSKLAVDIGGTFTDVVFRDHSGVLRTAKVPTTPSRITEGILDGIDHIGGEPAGIDVFVHGTTIALNALLERRTPPVGLITTRGFRDVLEIMRTNRPHMYDLQQDKPTPLVPRRLRSEVGARMDYRGTSLENVDIGEIERIASDYKKAGVESVALCLLHSYANPEHEREIASALKDLLPDVAVTLSSSLAREWREFERTSTAVINAATIPVMRNYLSDLQRELSNRDFGGHLLIMQSNGGATTATDVRERPVASLMSGPAGAVTGASQVASEMGAASNLVTLDIGGTSADVAVIEGGNATVRTLAYVGGWPIIVPSLDIESIGAGGGSIVRVDAFGGLSVGPESAGADPGPACYRRGGTDATVTDAQVVLGRIDADEVLGGAVSLDVDAARRAVAHAVASRYGMSIEEAADGIVTVANSNMARLLWEMIIGRGRDPRDFTLVALGGGGGLHACELAQALEMDGVIVPPDPGTFSARGMLAADIRHDYTQTLIMSDDGEDPAAVDAAFAALERLAYARFETERMGYEDVILRRMIELRYRGQRGGLQVEIDGQLRGQQAVDAARAAFASEHERLFGFRRKGTSVDVVRIQLSLYGRAHDKDQIVASTRTARANSGQRQIWAGGTTHDAIVIAREELPHTPPVRGPCLIHEATATTYVPPGWLLHLDPYKNLRIRRE